MFPREPRRRQKPPTLTKLELETLSAIEDLIDESSYLPSYSQILGRLNWSQNSTGSLSAYIKRLREEGVVEGSGRTLCVIR